MYIYIQYILSYMIYNIHLYMYSYMYISYVVYDMPIYILVMTA